jgi:hypothetical protein
MRGGSKEDQRVEGKFKERGICLLLYVAFAALAWKKAS